MDDEDAILRCAATVGRSELLAPLHLLTAADSVATGPATWTPWTDALVGTLVSRLDAALSPAVDGAGLVERAEKVRAATIAALPEGSTAQIEFVRTAHLRYLASREPAHIARDARLVAELTASSAADAALIAVSPGPVAGTHSVTVAAPDRPELLARLAGAMALSGLDILSVDAYGAPRASRSTYSWSPRPRSGRSVPTPSPPSSGSLAPHFATGSSSLRGLPSAAVTTRARSDAPVKVETIPSGWDTAIRVTAPDRPGLLHDIARAVSSEGVDIRWAKVQTIAGLARDTFHVVGPDGGPVDDPGVLGHIAMRIRTAV